MTGNDELERLREAFRADAGAGRDVDAERVWRAVSGDLPANERREVVDLVALDPGYAEAWRLAVELQHAMAESETGGAPETRTGQVLAFSKKTGKASGSWLAAAAALLAVAGVGVLVARLASPPPEPVFRQPGTTAVASLVGEAAMPRSRFLLRWTELPPGTRYEVRVTTAELDVLADEPDLRVNEYLVPEDRLGGLAAGTTLLWQVEARLPDGSVVSSETFVNELE